MGGFFDEITNRAVGVRWGGGRKLPKPAKRIGWGDTAI